MNPHELINVLRFDRPTGLVDAPWRELLEFTDREHLTLALGLRCGPSLPGWVRSRIESNLSANAERFARAQRVHREIAAVLEAEGIESAVLKGFSNWPGYSIDPRHRPQYDLDLLCRPDQVMAARDALRPIGYEPAVPPDGLPVDHLPPLIRKTDWQWTGDYFDVDIPFSVELHFRLWDEGTERIAAEGLDDFWQRRKARRFRSFSFTALDPVDGLGYAALHLLRHLLRGDFRLYHAYELAHFVEHTSSDDAFWSRWRRLHADSTRQMEAISLRLAAEWFGSHFPEVLREEFERAPEPIQRWFRLFALSPIDAKVRPNKNELWLHLSLLEAAGDKGSVLRRRLLPAPRQRALTSGRAWHHLRAAIPVATGGLRWWWSGKELKPEYLVFLTAASLFNFGLTVFFLLFNLFLVQRGYREDFIGLVASAMSLGSVAGTLPAPFVLHRFGLRRVLIGTFAGVSIACVVRVLGAASPLLLVAASFTGGFLFSFYAVSIAPAVAEFTTERSRAFGFSLVFSLGIGIGVIAGIAGGRLPGLASLQTTLMLACGLAALAAVAAARLRFHSLPVAARRVYPRNPFFVRMLGALLIWNLATGAFNPFFNLYFANGLGMPVSQIGSIYSGAQLVQVFAVLGAPLVLRRLGVISGVAGMQLATAAALAALALGPHGFIAGALYAAYMGFQYMSEPGIYTLLMDGVPAAERSGASALNFLVIFGGQALAAAIAGFGVRRFGYSVVVTVAALMAVLAGIVFRLIRGRADRPTITSSSEVRCDPSDSALPRLSR